MTGYTPQPRPPTHHLQHALTHTCTSLDDYSPYCWLCHTDDRTTP